MQVSNIIHKQLWLEKTVYINKIKKINQLFRKNLALKHFEFMGTSSWMKIWVGYLSNSRIHSWFLKIKMKSCFDADITTWKSSRCKFFIIKIHSIVRVSCACHSAMTYMFTGLAGYLINPKISWNTHKLTRTSRIIYIKKWYIVRVINYCKVDCRILQFYGGKKRIS